MSALYRIFLAMINWLWSLVRGALSCIVIHTAPSFVHCNDAMAHLVWSVLFFFPSTKRRVSSMYHLLSIGFCQPLSDCLWFGSLLGLKLPSKCLGLTVSPPSHIASSTVVGIHFSLVVFMLLLGTITLMMMNRSCSEYVACSAALYHWFLVGSSCRQTECFGKFSRRWCSQNMTCFHN